VITIDVPTSTILTAEDVRDIIGAALIGTGAINVTPNDAGDVDHDHNDGARCVL
jgi:hypothetical protein